MEAEVEAEAGTGTTDTTGIVGLPVLMADAGVGAHPPTGAEAPVLIAGEAPAHTAGGA